MYYKINVKELLKSIKVEGIDWKLGSTICRSLTQNGKIINLKDVCNQIKENYEWSNQIEYNSLIKMLYEIVVSDTDNINKKDIEKMKKEICKKCIEYIKMLLNDKNRKNKPNKQLNRF
jgi:hypothetical protein